MKLHKILILAAVASVGGCADDAATTENGSTGSMPTSTSTPSMSTSTTDGETTMAPPPGTTTMVDPSETGTTTLVAASSSSSDSGSSSTTSMLGADCVDLVLESKLGNAVASGDTAGHGNNFTFEDCDLTLDPLPGSDFVIEWTAPGTETYSFDLVDSDFDSVLSILPADCEAASAYQCNDDCDSFTSAIGYDATEGETIFIVIEGYWGTTGHFELDIHEGVDPDCCDDDTWGYCGSTFGGWSTTTYGGGGWSTTTYGGGGWSSSSGWGSDTDGFSSGDGGEGGFTSSSTGF